LNEFRIWHIEMSSVGCYLIAKITGCQMAARDRYSRKLECSNCGHQGFAEVSETDDKRSANVDFRVDEMPRGFRAERPSSIPSEFMIRCSHCGNQFRFVEKTAYAQGGEPRKLGR
jgi:DNA-directed RNA polymerase subunit RPC12/RpoP